jgi:hypothetical protein
MSEASKPEMAELTPPERKRVYHVEGGHKFELTIVTHFLARPSGTHRLRTADGRLWVIPAAVVNRSAIEIDADGWTL